MPIRILKTRCPSSRVNKHVAFTLVELLVVIAIIGVLVGLLLPAVQAAREAARRSSCTNNLAQLGLAVHHHEFSTERLPSGVINPDGPIRSEAIGQHVSWTLQIMPFLEQRAVYEHFDINAGAYAPINQPVRSAPISTLLCLSNPIGDRHSEPSPSIAYSHYAGSYHDSEVPIDSDNNGVLFLNSRLRYSDIRDGSSNTLLIGESIPYPGHLGWVSGTRATLRNTAKLVQTREWRHPNNEPEAQPGALEVGSFSSFHTGGVNFVLCDGAVRFVTLSINEELLHQITKRADGEIIQQLW